MSDRKAIVRGLRLSARLSYPTSNVRDPDHYATIRIEDEDSRQIVAEIELDPGELFKLMANRTAHGTGYATGMSDRLGRRMVTEMVHLDRKEWGLEYNSSVDHPAIRANMKAYRDAGWEIVEYRTAHGQHRLLCTKWEDRDELDTGGPGPDAADA